MTPNSPPFSLQSFGLFQLENLRRQQTKFVLIALTETVGEVPTHPLLKVDFAFEPSQAAEKIQALVHEHAMPAWWPFVLISRDGAEDRAVAEKLADNGLINVYSYRGGWTAFANETKIPLPSTT